MSGRGGCTWGPRRWPWRRSWAGSARWRWWRPRRGCRGRRGGPGRTSWRRARCRWGGAGRAAGAGRRRGAGGVPRGGVRRRGAGRPRAESAAPGLAEALEALIDEDCRGDPMSPLKYTAKGAESLARELTRQGHPCSKPTVLRLLHAGDYSTQGNAKMLEGRDHPDRDAQFRYISRQARHHLAAGDPVISVDAKKKEK